MLLGLGLIVATVAAVLVAYFGMRRIMPAEPDERTRDLAASVLFRISALHGLVLALVFASEVVQYQQLGFEIAAEVNAVSDIYYDAARYGEDAEGVRTELRDYLRVVRSDEWESLGVDGDLSGEAWALWESVYAQILDLTPASARQESLRENMLKKVHAIAENRDLREHQANSALDELFWVAALAGVLLVSAGYYTFPVRRSTVMLLSFYAVYTGFILFTVFAMSNPFKEPAALQPVLFDTLLTELQG